MEWYSLSEKESKELTKAKIIELEGSYFTLKSNYLQKNGGNEVAQNVIDSLELTEAIAAGISLWNTTCPRYHSYDKNMYEAYHRDRVSEGFHFFDSCTESSDILSNDSCSEILSPTNGFDQLAVNRSVGDFMQFAESASKHPPF